MSTELIVLRLVHVLGAILWLGSGLFSTFFLVPALGRAGPAVAGPLMGALQQRRMFSIMPIVAGLTLLSGFRLLQIMSAGFAPAYMSSGPGRTFLWSGVAATAAFFIGLLVARPLGVRAGQLGAAMASVPEDQRAARMAELERVKRRGALVSNLAMALLIGAAAGMAIGRYVG